MKQNTFFKKASVIIGVLSIISLLFTVISCEDTSKDKKSTKITFKYTEPATAEKAKQLAVVEKKDGGVKKDGKADKKVYYTVAAPDGTKYVSSITASADSKADISYKLKSHKIESGKDKMADATAAEGKVEKGGKVTFGSSTKGFFYLEATAKAKGDYKKATKRVLLVVGDAIPIPTKAVVLKEFVKGSSGSPYEGDITINTEKTEVTLGAQEDGKTLKVTAEINYKLFPSEAPMMTGNFTYTIASGGGSNNLLNSIAGNVITTGSGSTKTDIDINVAISQAGTYAALAEQKLVTVKAGF